jgi:hypothetical protein
MQHAGQGAQRTDDFPDAGGKGFGTQFVCALLDGTQFVSTGGREGQIVHDFGIRKERRGALLRRTLCRGPLAVTAQWGNPDMLILQGMISAQTGHAQAVSALPKKNAALKGGVHPVRGQKTVQLARRSSKLRAIKLGR